MPRTVLFNEFAVHVSRIAATASRRLVISSPYITKRGTSSILDHVGPELCSSGELLVLTDCSAGNVASGSLELTALRNLLAATKRSRLVHIPNLHAKAYANDAGIGLVTSANLTTGGMLRNVELGVLVEGVDAEALVGVLDHWHRTALAFRARNWTSLLHSRLASRKSARRGPTGRSRSRSTKPCDLLRVVPQRNGRGRCSRELSLRY